MRAVSVVAFAVLAAMVLLPSSQVLAGSTAEEGDSGSPPGPTPSPGAATQQFRYPTTADFVENQGQLHRPDIFFYTTSGDVQVGFAESAVLVKIVERTSAPIPAPMNVRSPDSSPLESSSSRGVLVRIAFEGSHPVRPEGVDPLPYRSHYFLGNDPAGWRTDVPHYAQVVYRDLYDGVDVAYRVGAEGLKYDITVRAGADPGKIAMAYEGVEGLEADGVGLAVHTALGDLFDSIPRSYQGGEEVACRFFLRTTLSYGFDCAGWDASLPLVIDPLLYSTFLGGGESDGWSSVAVDASGSVYGTGTTYSTGFPTTPGAFDSTYNGGFTDAFVTKLNPTGSGLLYSAFLGGIDWDNGVSIAVDASGSAYVIGYTVSTDFPTTPVAFDTSHNGGWNDAFVTKLNPTGSGLLYSTFLGGGDIDEGFSVGVDASGSAYVTGRTWSTDFPTTPGAFDTSHNSGVDAFVTKLNPTGSGLLYSTYLGGGDSDWGFSVAVDSLGSAYLNGVTLSTDFPTTPGAFDTSYNGGGMFGYDVFVTKLNPTGSGLPYSTFLGGGDEEWGYSLAVDASGSAYVTGLTRSTDFPTTPGAFDTSYNGGYQYDAFVAKLDPTGNGLLYSTFLGGGDSDGGSSIAVDASGSAYVTGGTTSTDFPTTPGAFDNTCGTDGNCNFDGFYYGDAFVTKLNPTGSGLLYSTFLGGGDSDGGSSIAVDASGSAYVTGGTTSTDFPTTSGAFDTTHNGEDDAFVANLDLPAEPNAPPLLILTAPLGGEVWDQGSSHAVTWTASDNQDPSTSLVVFINYTSSGGSGTICGPVPGFPGSCDWIAPNIIATDVVVNGTVIDTGGLNGWDESGPFTIQVPPPSTPPTADAGPDQSAFKNDPMVLDGSASSDPDMDPLAYDWVQSSGPQSVTLVPVNASAVTFTAPTGTGAAGVYMFDLTVSDPSGANDTDTANVTVVNRIPVADAGADQVIAGPGSPVLLNGTGSYDPDAEPLSYFWWQIAGPIALFINNATSAVADFIAPLLGVYCFELVVTDPDGANASDGVCVTVQDNPPTALAVATPMIGFIGTPFLFDATGSTDDVGVTAYLWDFGDTATGTNPLSTHAYTARGTFTVSLTVSDTAGQNDTDTLTIQIENRAPTASAIATTPPIYRGQIVVLDGTGSSDPDGDSLTFSWRQVSGPEVSLTGANTATASFVPTELGSYGFNLTVDDGFGGSDEASVMVTVLNRNPVADAGPDQPAAAKNIVLTLDASASSDPDGDALTYAWTAPLGITLSDANSPTPTFTATRSDTYTFLLQVDDGLGGVATDTVVVTVLNTPPVAVANAPATAAKYAPVSLDGTASSDPDGDALTYVWTRVSGPFVTINGQDGALAAFTPAVSGTYGFRLTVDDGDVGGTATDDVVVTATNAAPIAAAGPDQVGVFRGATVTLDGTGSSDPDGDPLTYSWTQTSGPAVALAGANTVTPSFTPAAAGTHVFALTVDDGFGGTNVDEITVDVVNRPPTADAGPDQSGLFRNMLVAVDGTPSTDPDGDPLTYSWTQTTGPAVALTGANTATPSFTPAAAGTYTFQLTVDDGLGGTDVDEVTVTVVNRAPTADAGGPYACPAGGSITFNGSGSTDPDGDALTYAWTVDLTSPVTLSGPTPTFFCPSTGATVTVTLAVTDPDGFSDADDAPLSIRQATGVADWMWLLFVLAALIVLLPILILLFRRKKRDEETTDAPQAGPPTPPKGP